MYMMIVQFLTRYFHVATRYLRFIFAIDARVGIF